MNTTPLNHRLSVKLGVVVALVGTVCMLGMVIVGDIIVKKQFGALEEREIVASVSRTNAAIENIEQAMLAKARDWGNWDDSERYLRGENPGFEENNLDPLSLKNLDAQAVALVRFDRQFSHGHYYNLDTLKRDPSQYQEWMKYALSRALQQRITKERELSSFVRVGNKLLAIGATAVFKTDGTGTPQGYIIIGSEVSLHTVSDLLQVKATYNFDSNNNSPYFVERNDNSSTVQIPVHGLYSQPVAHIVYQQRREIAAAGQTFKFSMMLGVAVMIIVMIMTLYIIARVGVTNRLTKMQRHLRVVSSTGELTPIEIDNIEDEIGKLQSSFNQMIEELAKLELAEAAKTKALNELEISRESEKAKSRFIAMISHELRTPLTGLIGSIQLLKNIKSDAQRIEFLDRLDESAGLLRRLIDDVLDFSKLESEAPTLELHPLDLNMLAQSVVETYDAAASAKAVQLYWKIHGDRTVVLADKLRLQQILGNLISNAIKFSSQGKVGLFINARCRTDDGFRWRFEVKDEGIGIPKEIQSQLFRPFVQGDGSTTRKYGGTGLGLSICKRLVEAMSGEIGIISESGHGATFWFEVDLKESELPQISRAGGQNVPSDGGAALPQLNVLMAEDSPVIQMVTAETLKSFGHQVTMVENGQEALDAVTRGNFDVVIMDMQMPVMDGAEASRQIRALGGPYRTLPIVALTADADVSRRHIYADCEFNGFMTKPFDSGPLMDLLHQVTRDRPSPPEKMPQDA